MNVLMLIGSLVFCAFGIIVMLAAVVSFRKSCKSRTWPHVMGTVVSSSVEEHVWRNRSEGHDHASYNVRFFANFSG